MKYLAPVLAVASACTSEADPAPRWTPAAGTPWQWQLVGAIDTSIDAPVYDVDAVEAPAEVIAALHAAGRRVICYFDTAYEPYRADAARLEPYRGNPMDGWPGQYWVDQRAPEVRAVMADRIAAAAARGCDAVEPDDVDAIDNDPGFPLTAADQLDFCRFLADTAHAHGLAVGLKNNLAQIPALVDDFDFAINEECHAYDECAALAPFVAAGKPVWNAEYTDGDLATLAAQVCPAANAANLDTIIKHLDLSAARVACR